MFSAYCINIPFVGVDKISDTKNEQRKCRKHATFWEEKWWEFRGEVQQEWWLTWKIRFKQIFTYSRRQVYNEGCPWNVSSQINIKYIYFITRSFTIIKYA